jgi:hypothetical protein
MDTPNALSPRKDIVFLPGNFAPSSGQLDQLGAFVRFGGTVWIHRLTPETPFLEHLSKWVGQPLELRPSQMWLQQLETSSKPPPF